MMHYIFDNRLLRRFAIAVGAIVVCALVAMGFAASTPSSAYARGEAGLVIFEHLSDIMIPSTHEDKLAGCEETVDADGIVHGVTSDGIRYTVYGRGETTGPISAMGTVSFAAVGDVLGTTSNLPIVDRYAGVEGDGQYDFLPYYRDVKDEILDYDITFINQETICAGAERGYSGYPVFNTPDASVHAIGELGFDVVNLNTNHTWDMGAAGIERNHELLAQYPQTLVAGSFLTQEDRDTVQLVERNGTTFAFLSYLYGDNAYGLYPPISYYTCTFDKDVMAAEIARAKQVADAVIVYLHWGTEYTPIPDGQQEEYARFLADQDVDLVIGSHAHILQPIRYVTGDSGNTVPVVFGLSDFISGWTITNTILSGMFSCDFVWSGGELTVQNAEFTLANFMRTHLASAVATLSIGMDILTKTEKVKIEKIYGHGGFFKTPGVGQRILSAAIDTPISVMETAGEGGPYGMALLCAYMLWKDEGESLPDYLDNKVFADSATSTLMADPEEVAGFRVFLERYKKALPVERCAVEVM